MINRIATVAAIVAVAAGLWLAFTIIGSPRHARLQALDDRRSDDLETIASTMHDRYGKSHGPLPTSVPKQLRDPQTQKPYEYRRSGGTKYVLCAVYDLGTDKDRAKSESWSTRDWPAHSVGKTCYVFDASVSPYDRPPIIAK